MSGSERSVNRWYRLLIVVGGAPLLCAMLIDSVAVVGRHLRMPLNGSIELVQSLLAISGATAILVATLAGVHAVVHLLIDRLPLHARVWPVRTTQLISALYFIVLVAGGLWLTADMWSGHEQSELLGIPFRPLRIFANASLAGAAGAFLFRALRRDRE